MKKIAEIDSALVYEKTGVMPYDRNWLQAALTVPQYDFVTQFEHAHRCHPKHAPTRELFVNENQLSDRQFTVLRLLF